ncbi:6-phosphofructokinase [Candidatus Sumerlaeota bacterium]|nr:6-phosphofructokinase [Candidatus Sumerlaeota bacterium]
MPKRIKRIGILTGGGDCPGINAVIRSVTKTVIEKYGAKVLGIKDGFLGLIKERWRELSYEDVSSILTLGGTILGTSNRDDPFHWLPDKEHKSEPIDVSDTVIENYKRLKLDALVCIGGDGTLSIANKLHKKGLNIVGVPKTIDNDLCETDYTFGFNTAVNIVMEAIDRIHTTASSHHRVMVVETMGRYAGWLALEAGVAGGGDIILIPEIPFNWDSVCRKVKERNRRGKRFSIVVVAEGTKPPGGELVIKRIIGDKRPENIRLGGIGSVVAEEIENRTGVETRYIVLGHLQRGGSPTAFDRLLATRFGYVAAEMIAEGRFGYMPALRGNKIKPVLISRAVRKIRRVPKNYLLIEAARSIGTSFGDD